MTKDHEHKEQGMKAKPGHIIDEHGNEFRVVGTLPKTADDVIVGHGVHLYWGEDPFERSDYATDFDGAYFDDHATDCHGEPIGKTEPISKCYSTREAAEAAKATK